MGFSTPHCAETALGKSKRLLFLQSCTGTSLSKVSGTVTSQKKHTPKPKQTKQTTKNPYSTSNI